MLTFPNPLPWLVIHYPCSNYPCSNTRREGSYRRNNLTTAHNPTTDVGEGILAGCFCGTVIRF